VRRTARASERSNVRLPQHFGSTAMVQEAKVFIEAQFDHMPSTAYR
jgi:hypothetical protein